MTEQLGVERLTSLDLLMPRTYIRVLLTFRTRASSDTASQNLQHGLDRLLCQVPWLSGKVIPTTSKAGTQNKSTPSLEIHWCSKDEPAALTLIHKGTISASYDAMAEKGIPPTDIPSDVWPVPYAIDDVLFAQGAPVFAASLFHFAESGDIGVCICVHHSAVDATGFAEIVRLWAQNTAGFGATSSSSWSDRDRLTRLSKALSLHLDKTSLLSAEDLFTSHPEYSSMPPTLPKAGLPPCTSKLFSLSVAHVSALKERVLRSQNDAQSPVSRPLSTNTVVCALIWSSIIRARAQRDESLVDNVSRLVMAVDGRRRIDDPSFSRPGDPYLGNAVLYSLAELSVEILTRAMFDPVADRFNENKSLSVVCDSISESQSPARIDTRHIAEVHSLVDGVDDYRSVFPGWDLFGSRDLTITSWADLDLYDMDFGVGIGKAEFVRLPYMEADGVCLILPRKGDRVMDATGRSGKVVDVMVMLRRDDMETLENDDSWKSFLC